jgi:hypothetical protein
MMKQNLNNVWKRQNNLKKITENPFCKSMISKKFIYDELFNFNNHLVY